MIKKTVIITLTTLLLLFCSLTVSASTGASLDVSSYTTWVEANYNTFNAPYDMDDVGVNITGNTGQMTVRECDLSLPGKNGLDVNIFREHQTITDLLRIEGNGNWTYTEAEVIQARYILPDGNYKLVNFRTADEYYQNGENGIYISSLYTSTGTQFYCIIAGDSVYLERDVTFEPIRTTLDTTYRVREFVNMTPNRNRLNIGYDWYIPMAYSEIIVDPYSIGLDNLYERYRVFKLSNGCAFTLLETYSVDNQKITYYTGEVQQSNEYKIITPYKGMADQPITDNERGITYFYSIKHKSGKIWYFNNLGDIIAEEDKYGNMIKYQFQDNKMIITDTMDRIVTIDKSLKKISLTIDDVTEDVVYYEFAHQENVDGDFDNYMSTFELKVKKPEGDETQENCQNVSTYKMKLRSNMYDRASDNKYTPYNHYTYLITKIINPDGAYSEFEYEPVKITNEKSHPFLEYMPSHSQDVGADGISSNSFDYSFRVLPLNSDGNNNVRFTTTRADGYTVTDTFDRDTKHINREVIGDGIKTFDRYYYDDYLITKIVQNVYDPQSENTDNKITTISLFEYDNRDNCISENIMGKKVLYDYGTKETNPNNILLRKEYDKDGQTIKIENTLLENKKDIGDTKEYIKENEEFVLKNHTSYTYDNYGNINKIITRPDSSEIIENHITYTYTLPTYRVETYTENVYSYDGTVEEIIGTVEEYDKYGRLWRYTDANGNQTTYSYDKLGRLLSVTNPDNTSKTYDYDATKNEVVATNEVGTKIKQTYDLRGRELATYVFDPDKSQYVKLQEITYDENGGNVKSAMTLGAHNKELVTNYTWDDDGRIKSKETLHQQYDGTYLSVDENYYSHSHHTGCGTFLKADGDTSETVNPSYYLIRSKSKTFTLNKEYEFFSVDVNVNEENLYIYTIDENGKQTKIEEYSVTGNYTSNAIVNCTTMFSVKDITAVKIATGSNTDTDATISNIKAYKEGDYDDITIKTTTQTIGDSTITPAIIEETFDVWGNKIKEKAIDSSNDNTVLKEEIWTYDSLGNNTTYKSPVSSSDSVSKTYDYAGRVLTETTFDNVFDNFVVTNSYDNIGRLISTSNTLNTDTYEYDKLGRVISENHCETGGIKYKYDKNGNVIRRQETVQPYGSTDVQYNTTDYEYDNRNRLVKTTQYQNGTTLPVITQYYYDGVGNVLRVYTGLTSPLVINGLDNVTAGADNNYNVTKYQYNFMGYVVSTTDALNQTETMTYDYVGNVLFKTDKNDCSFEYNYNWRSQLLQLFPLYGDGLISYTYDKLGNRKTMNGDNGTTLYTYDSLSRCIIERTGTTVKNNVYDANGNRTSFQLVMNNTPVLSAQYTYSSSGLLTGVSSGTENITYTYNQARQLTGYTQGDINATYTYNNSGYLTDLVYNIDGVQYLNNQNTLLANGNISSSVVSITDNPQYTTSYTYDGLNRLLTETSNYNNINNTYTYDDFSNRTAITNQTTYTYGLNNRLLTETGTVNKTYEYDANGNLRWERFLTPVNGTEHATPDDNHYYYNLDRFDRVIYLGNIIDSFTNYYNSDGLRTAKMINGVTTYYVLDGDNVIAETTNGVTTTYLRGLMLHSRKVGDTKTDYIYNTQGDVVQLLDNNGDVVADYKYDAFGNRFTETTDPNPFGYRGEFHDSCSELIYLRNRYYDPSIGRFITEDPARDGLNWYVYCGNNPVNFVDPLGLEQIVVSGGEYKKDGKYKYNFIEPAIKKLEELKNNSNGELVTWLIANTGWDKSDLEKFERVASDMGVRLAYFSNVDNFVKYINNKYPNENRSLDRISKFVVFAHGWQGTISFGYNYSNYNTSLDFEDTRIKDINSNAFNNPNSAFYSCNTGTDDYVTSGSSFAQKWVNKVGGKTWAWNTYTFYDIFKDGSFWQKRYVDFNWFIKEGATNYPVGVDGTNPIVFTGVK